MQYLHLRANLLQCTTTVPFRHPLLKLSRPVSYRPFFCLRSGYEESPSYRPTREKKRAGAEEPPERPAPAKRQRGGSSRHRRSPPHLHSIMMLPGRSTCRKRVAMPSTPDHCRWPATGCVATTGHLPEAGPARCGASPLPADCRLPEGQPRFGRSTGPKSAEPSTSIARPERPTRTMKAAKSSSATVAG